MFVKRRQAYLSAALACATVLVTSLRASPSQRATAQPASASVSTPVTALILHEESGGSMRVSLVHRGSPVVEPTDVVARSSTYGSVTQGDDRVHLSPDGRYLAYVTADAFRLRDLETGTDEVLVAGGERGSAFLVTFSDASDAVLVYAIDGVERAQDEGDETTWHGHFLLLPTSGSRAIVPMRLEEDDEPLLVDGDHAIWLTSRSPETAANRLTVHDPLSGRRRTLARGVDANSFNQFTRAGAFAAWVDSGRTGPAFDIVLARRDLSGRRALGMLPGTGGRQWPRFSPDGSRLLGIAHDRLNGPNRIEVFDTESRGRVASYACSTNCRAAFESNDSLLVARDRQLFRVATSGEEALISDDASEVVFAGD